MNNDDIKLTFAKEDYKLGKILAKSAIVSDAPLGPVKPKRNKLKLFIKPTGGDVCLPWGLARFHRNSDRCRYQLT